MEKTNQPLYQQLMDDIRSQIENSLLLPGDKLPTEHEFMQKYKVSRITVSKALNELKAEGLITRFPNKGSFVARSASPLAAATQVPLAAPTALPPVSVQTGLPVVRETASYDTSFTEIACILPSISDQFSLSMVNGVLSAFPTDSYICHIFQSFNPSLENRLLQKCIDIGIKGIVLFPQDQPFFSDQLLYMLLQKYPLVLLDRNLPRLDTSYVIGDNKTGGALCLRHLHTLGHQRFCFVSSARRDTFTVKSRISGIFQEAEERNIPETSIMIWDSFNKHQPYSHYHTQMMKLIREERITAFIAAESTTCAYLYSLFATMNIRVPEDVSLMSFDKPLVESQRPDFFTHISQSEYLMGKEAGAILKNQIETKDPQVTHRVMSPHLEIRKSTRAIVL